MNVRVIFPLVWLIAPAPAFSAESPPPVEASTLTGKVMCGYQGWFSTPGDRNNLGWGHYGFGKPGQCHIDLWPDVSGFGADELFETPLKFADGTPASVFSSGNAKTVERHFEWMKTYGIDGVFLQRFGASVRDARSRAFRDKVQEAVRASARRSGRTWALMYDLSGLKAGEIESVVMQDWKRQRNELRITDDPNYQRHAGRPVVAVWGIGFNDGRAYTLAECGDLVRFLRDNPEFGGACVMVGVPFGWRTLDRDCVHDPAFFEAVARADLISPWAVGRYANPQQAEDQIRKVHADDEKWCREHNMSYLPVVFPGFSWVNLMTSRNQPAKLDAIPRLGGEFLWRQGRARIEAGGSMLYVAMFDEMDEGTAIFKCADRTPEGALGFVKPGAGPAGALPSDHYLWLAGMIGKALRHEIPASPEMPKR